jgi:hypothetical protein
MKKILVNLLCINQKTPVYSRHIRRFGLDRFYCITTLERFLCWGYTVIDLFREVSMLRLYSNWSVQYYQINVFGVMIKKGGGCMGDCGDQL